MTKREKLPDDVYHEPYKIKDHRTRKRLTREITEAINDGLPVVNAFRLAGIPKDTYYKWIRWYKEDAEKGFTGTALMCFLEDVAKAEDELHRKLVKKGFELANDGNYKMLTYLLDTRFKYANRKKKEVEVSTKEDTGIEISITNMTPIEKDNKEE